MKGLSPVVALILLIIIVVSLSAMIMSMLFSVTQKTSATATSQIKTTTARLENCLRLDAVEENYVYIRNCGAKEFSGKIRVYVNNTGACISTGPQNHGIEVNLTISPNTVKRVQIDCCIPQGTTSLRITSDKYLPLTGKITNYQFPQNVFFDWEETEIFNLNECLVHDALCTTSCNHETGKCYKNCAIGQEQSNLLEQHVRGLEIEKTWSTAIPPYHYNWNMGNCDESDPLSDCGYCFTKMLRTKFYYNPAAFEGKDIWFVDGATQPACRREGKDGIVINSNIYVFVNNELIGFGGASYEGFCIGSVEDGPWCTYPMELTNPQFSEECAVNNITVAVEDWRRAGGVESFYLHTE